MRVWTEDGAAVERRKASPRLGEKKFAAARLQTRMFVDSHKKRIDPTRNSNNTTKTLPARHAGGGLSSFL
jgi:hypothetical protein